MVGFEAPNAGRRDAEGEPREALRVTHMVGFLPISVLGEPDLAQKPPTELKQGSTPPGYPEVEEAVKHIRVLGYNADRDLVAESGIDDSPSAAIHLSG